MGNHFHLVLHTRQGNLSRLMRHINGVYTQQFNRRHGLVGHLFQGRFKAILVDRDAYLMALCRYVERNAVAAGLVATADEWAWSSYRAHVCKAPTPSWLDSDGLHGYLLGRSVASDRDRRRAAQKYAALVTDADEREASLWQTVCVSRCTLATKTSSLACRRWRQPSSAARAMFRRRSASRPAGCRIA